MKAEDLLLFHIRNIHEKLGLKWYDDTNADVAAIINLLKAEMKEELLKNLEELKENNTKQLA
jgi:hypothetical protein